MTATAHAVSEALLHFLWQGLLAAFITWAALNILRNRTAKLRYTVSAAALAVMSLLPLLTAWLLYRAPHAASTAGELAPGAPESAIQALAPGP
jgi:hypothetical protein